MDRPHLSDKDLGLTPPSMIPDKMATSTGEVYHIDQGKASLTKERAYTKEELDHLWRDIRDYQESIKATRIGGNFTTPDAKYAKTLIVEPVPENTSLVHLVLEVPLDIEGKVDGNYDIGTVAELLRVLDLYDPWETGLRASSMRTVMNQKIKQLGFPNAWSVE